MGTDPSAHLKVMTHVSTFPRSLSHGRKAEVAYNSSSLRRDRRQDGARGSANNIDNMGTNTREFIMCK